MLEEKANGKTHVIVRKIINPWLVCVLFFFVGFLAIFSAKDILEQESKQGGHSMIWHGIYTVRCIERKTRLFEVGWIDGMFWRSESRGLIIHDDTQ